MAEPEEPIPLGTGHLRIHRINITNAMTTGINGSPFVPRLFLDQALECLDHLVELVGFMQEMIDSGMVDLCL